MPPPKLKMPSVLPVLAALLVTLGVARGGHELPVYPSYYPHEIAIETMPPERAVESLGSFIIVRINPAARSAPDERSACAVVETIARDMADKPGFVFHPYPVTPLHGDYLYHVDRAEAAKARLLGAPAALPPQNLMVRASGALADLVRPEWRAQGPD